MRIVLYTYIYLPLAEDFFIHVMWEYERQDESLKTFE